MQARQIDKMGPVERRMVEKNKEIRLRLYGHKPVENRENILLRQQLLAANTEIKRLKTRLDKFYGHRKVASVKNFCWLDGLEFQLSGSARRTTIGQVYRGPVTRIVDVVCQYYGYSREEVLSPRRKQELVRARHIIMYIAAKATVRSLPEIGRALGGRDHTTIIHGRNKIEDVLNYGCEQLEIDIERIMGRI